MLVHLAPAAAACTSLREARAVDEASRAAGTGVWSYDVEVAADASSLQVKATFPRGTGRELGIDRPMERFVEGLELPFDTDARAWSAPECASGCTLHYRFQLARAGEAVDESSFVAAYEDAIVAPPSSWLVRPTEAPRGTKYRLRVKTAGAAHFATGIFPSGEDTHEADALALPRAPFSVFGKFEMRVLELGGGKISVAILGRRDGVQQEELITWVREAAENVSAYYGRFPVSRVLVIVAPRPGDDFGYGTTLGDGGAAIFLGAGRAVTKTMLAEDWQLTHEMVHLAFPNIPRRHHWLEEGIATYVEPIARVRTGRLGEKEMWRELVVGLPKGLPEHGDRGLDNTHTWGRTYWGGALFCFLADLEIRQQTKNQRSLGDALRGILMHGGDISVDWSLEAALAEGDRATGTEVLSALHGRLGETPENIDLDAIWTQLGVRVNEGTVELDDRAPLAEIRRAVTRAP